MKGLKHKLSNILPHWQTFFYLSLICLACNGCSRLQESEREKIYRKNAVFQKITRSYKDPSCLLETPVHMPRPSYPWECEIHLPRITKEFFRCRGTPFNPPISVEGKEELRKDCEGGAKHGLPLLGQKEGVYPILLNLLNYIQKKTGRRVIITSGHRCPEHNMYADQSKENRTSKHQIGAEVDFYVQGMEERPQEIVGLLMQYYQETSSYKNERDYLEFVRYQGTDTGCSILPWMNREIYIKLYKQDEGRDGDNRHPYPYVSIQVRYDREKKEKVVYTWEKAHRG